MVTAEDVSLRALETIPEESAKYYRMIPLAERTIKEGKYLEIGMVNPEDFKAREALDFLARQNRFTYKVFLITITNFENILKRYRTLREEVTKALEELESELKEEKVAKRREPKTATGFERIVEGSAAGLSSGWKSNL